MSLILLGDSFTFAHLHDFTGLLLTLITVTNALQPLLTAPAGCRDTWAKPALGFRGFCNLLSSLELCPEITVSQRCPWVSRLHVTSQLCILIDFKLYFIFPVFFYCDIFFHFLNWSIVDLQCCVNFCCTAEWFSYTYIYTFFFIFFSIMSGFYPFLPRNWVCLAKQLDL